MNRGSAGTVLLVLFLMPAMVAAALYLPVSAQIVVPAIVLVVLAWVANPHVMLVLIVCMRTLVDMFWNIPGVAGLNPMEMYSGGVTLLAAVLCTMYGARVYRHAYFPAFATFVALVVFTLPSERDLRFASEEFARYLNPILLMFITTTLFVEDRMRRAVVVAMAVFGIVPIIVSLYYWEAGIREYLQGIPRLQGGYENLHNAAHAMAVFVVLGVMLLISSKRRWQRIFWATYTVAALFCMYETQVRTTLVGIATFAATFLMLERRYVTLLGFGWATATAILNSEFLQKRLVDILLIFQVAELDATEYEHLGSGRILIWRMGWEGFTAQHPYYWVFGSGLSARVAMSGGYLDTHNEYLGLLFCFGPFGLVLYLYFFYIVLKRSWWLMNEASSEYVRRYGRWFFAFTAMVIVTNGISNSFVSRMTPAAVWWCLGGILISYYDTERARKAAEGSLVPVHAPVSPLGRLTERRLF